MNKKAVLSFYVHPGRDRGVTCCKAGVPPDVSGPVRGSFFDEDVT